MKLCKSCVNAKPKAIVKNNTIINIGVGSVKCNAKNIKYVAFGNKKCSEYKKRG